METTRRVPQPSISHDVERRLLKIDFILPAVQEKDIAIDMKHDSFCISAATEGQVTSGCFPLEHEIDIQAAHTTFEDGTVHVVAPYKGWGYWDRLREVFMGKPVVKG